MGLQFGDHAEECVNKLLAYQYAKYFSLCPSTELTKPKLKFIQTICCKSVMNKRV
jgi:hypothetical protein